jgi:hypothetical protein
MKVTNQGTMALAIRIIEPRGVNYVHVAAKRTVDLPEGATVDSNWLALNPGVVKVHPDKPAALVQKTPAPAVLPKTPTKTVDIQNNAKEKNL